MQLYRPERLVFCRSVTVTRRCAIFREIGRVRTVKEGFGFARAFYRQNDLYFKLSELNGLGMDLDMGDQQRGPIITFDIETEDTHIANGK
jgi:hypothetical protein